MMIHCTLSIKAHLQNLIQHEGFSSKIPTKSCNYTPTALTPISSLLSNISLTESTNLSGMSSLLTAGLRTSSLYL